MTVAAAQFGMIGSAAAQSKMTKPADVPAVKPGTNTSFAPLKQIDAGVLSVGYAEAGPANGPVVILLHGWPYDIHSYVDVAPLLASAGYRVIVPYLRGYGTTRFLSSETMRNGQQAALAVDAVALMDALKIEKATVAGYDLGSRTADIVAALWPERCKALISVSGYLITNLNSGMHNPADNHCRQRLNWDGGTSIILPRNVAEQATTNTGTILTSSFGKSLRRIGTLMMLRSIAPQRPSTTQITSTS